MKEGVAHKNLWQVGKKEVCLEPSVRGLLVWYLSKKPEPRDPWRLKKTAYTHKKKKISPEQRFPEQGIAFCQVKPLQCSLPLPVLLSNRVQGACGTWAAQPYNAVLQGLKATPGLVQASGFCTEASNTKRVLWAAGKQVGMAVVWLEGRVAAQADGCEVLQQSAGGTKERQRSLVPHLSGWCPLGGRSMSADYPFQWGNTWNALRPTGRRQKAHLKRVANPRLPYVVKPRFLGKTDDSDGSAEPQ